MSEAFDHDLNWTLRNRKSLLSNQNLLLWYQKLYTQAFSGLGDPTQLQILEIGSGGSPLNLFYPNVITSDILSLPHVDHVFDCHDIDNVSCLGGHEFDLITMTNVLHHLLDPTSFLCKAATKLKKDGVVVAVEPFSSIISSILYRLFHHETLDFTVDEPKLHRVLGPLRSANMAIPQILFFREGRWRRTLLELYEFSNLSVQHFSCLSYMITGGISHKIPVPASIYKRFIDLDLELARRFPKICSSFFIMRLIKRN